MTLQQQLEQYDLQPGDLIEFTDGEIWLYRGNDANSLTCLKGSYDISLSLGRWDYECEHLANKTIKRVMRTDWKPAGSLMLGFDICFPFTELKPKPRKKLITVEVSSDFAAHAGDAAVLSIDRQGMCYRSKVVEVREK